MYECTPVDTSVSLTNCEVLFSCKQTENMRRVSNVQTSFLRRSNSETISSSEFEQVYPWQREGDESIVDGGLNNTKFQQSF
jgi:hypothetical protein